MNGPKSFTIGPHFTRVTTAVNVQVKGGRNDLDISMCTEHMLRKGYTGCIFGTFGAL